MICIVIFISLFTNAIQCLLHADLVKTNYDLKHDIALYRMKHLPPARELATTCPIMVEPEKEPAIFTLEGDASFYDYELPGGWTSLGHYVCATRDFERYSFVRATNLDNGKSVKCKITDFGPAEDTFPERIIDLSSTAFSQIADLSEGVVRVKVEQL